MSEIRIEYVKIETLIPYQNNARKHSDADTDAIIQSIREFGFNDPIGVWKNIIVEGHGRLIAAKRLGMEEVPVIRLDHLTDEQRKAYALAHNKTAELSGWDFDILAEELAELTDIDMSQFGFDLPEVDEYAEAVDDGYEGSLPEAPKVKKGEIWVCGNHRLMCGDSADPDDIQKLFWGGRGQDGLHGSSVWSGNRRQEQNA